MRNNDGADDDSSVSSAVPHSLRTRWCTTTTTAWMAREQQELTGGTL
jgi:hypothetical protein